MAENPDPPTEWLPVIPADPQHPVARPESPLDAPPLPGTLPTGVHRASGEARGQQHVAAGALGLAALLASLVQQLAASGQLAIPEPWAGGALTAAQLVLVLAAAYGVNPRNRP